MIKFYFNLAPNPTKVALCLEEMGLKYEIVPVDTRKGEQHTPAFLAVNPNAKVPAIVDDDVTVFDSNAILLYLAEKTGQFLPGTSLKARGEMLSWLMFVASGIGPYSGQAVHFRTYAPKPNDYAVNRYTFEAERHWKILERPAGQAPVHVRRYLHHRRHGGVGLVAADRQCDRPGGGGEAAQPAAPSRRDQRAARGGAGAGAEGEVQLQDRDGRGRPALDVPASARRSPDPLPLRERARVGDGR